MSEEKKIVEYKPDVQVESAKPEAETDQRLVVKFSKPYHFEGKEYTEVDLSGLEGLTVKDAIDVQRQLFNQQEVAASLLTETTTAFARSRPRENRWSFSSRCPAAQAGWYAGPCRSI